MLYIVFEKYYKGIYFRSNGLAGLHVTGLGS